MNTASDLVKAQYNVPGLFQKILDRLKQQGVDTNHLSRTDLSAVDEFHVRGAEVTKELVKELDFRHLRVVDIGCGIGGPARLLADEFHCHVSGIDLSSEFIDTAKKLTELVKLNGKTEFIRGNALELPFSDGIFDAAWTQHVQMNIEDKGKFYAEIYRVLKRGSSFVYYDIFRKDDGDISFPVPWADTPGASFLGTIANMEGILVSLGFTKRQTTDQTAKGISFLQGMLEKFKAKGAAMPGLSALTGALAPVKFGNVLKALEEGRIELQSGMYTK